MDAAAVEDVVRRYVDAPARGDDPRELVAEPLRVREEVRHLNRGLEPVPGFRAEVRRLEVERVDGDEATVQLAATRTWDGEDGECSLALSGPVQLRRKEGRWRIVEVNVDDRPLAASLYRCAAREIVTGDVRIAASCELGDNGCELGVVVENRGAGALSADVVVRGVVGFWGEYRPGPDWLGEIGPGARKGDVLAWQAGLPLRVVIAVSVDGGAAPVEHRFEFGPPAAIPWRQRLEALRPWAGIVGPAALIVGGCAYIGGPSGAGVGLLALGLVQPALRLAARGRALAGVTRTLALLLRAAVVLGLALIVGVAATEPDPVRFAAARLALAAAIALVAVLLWGVRHRDRP